MANLTSVHVSVLLDEVVEWLAPAQGPRSWTGPSAAAGTPALAERVGPDGLVIGLDRDDAAVEAARTRLAGLPVRLAEANFCDLPEVLDQWDIREVDGVVLDLGLSSDQLADASRGFSFSAEGPLDLRFDTSSGEPAWRLVNRLSAEHLADLIYHYGEERYSRRIARAIVERGAADRSRRRRSWPTWCGGAFPRRAACIRSTRQHGPFRPCGSPPTTS